MQNGHESKDPSGRLPKLSETQMHQIVSSFLKAKDPEEWERILLDALYPKETLLTIRFLDGTAVTVARDPLSTVGELKDAAVLKDLPVSLVLDSKVLSDEVLVAMLPTEISVIVDTALARGFSEDGSSPIGAVCYGPQVSGQSVYSITACPTGYNIESKTSTAHHFSMVLQKTPPPKWRLTFEADIRVLSTGAHYGTLVQVSDEVVFNGNDLVAVDACKAGTGWHEWSLVNDGSEINVYCDGELVRTIVGDVPIISVGSSINIGAHWHTGFDCFYSRADMSVKNVVLVAA